MKDTMTAEEKQHLVEQKLAAFDAMQKEFEASFGFVQDMHGQRRFETFLVADAVRYLHARWICERKGRLLSVAKTAKEYEGGLCLELLQKWQEGDTASVVDFLNRRLDMLPIADITRQVHEEYQARRVDGLLERLIHGRLVMLNRGMNLMHLLDTIFKLSEEDVVEGCTGGVCAVWAYIGAYQTATTRGRFAVVCICTASVVSAAEYVGDECGRDRRFREARRSTCATLAGGSAANGAE